MKRIYQTIALFAVVTLSFSCHRETKTKVNEYVQNYQSEVWTADNGDGTYRNPILHSDYSDPDVVRVGGNYYMTASSFNCVPGLPILHSIDMVNWRLKGYALERLEPKELFSTPQHGGGVWAPGISYHNGMYYIFFPDPDHGIYMIKASDPSGPWTDPLLIKEGKGFIDTSPLWDDDGSAYLVYAFAGSRAGIKSVLLVSRMSPDGTGIEEKAVMVFDGHDDNPTIEGPKFYRRNGYYYIFAPAGGVKPGWQLVLRSTNVFGPYEVRKVLHQGKSDINGPHQGAWVTTQTGEDWFFHFQDKGPYGRVVHLQPMKWIDDWPVIGNDDDGDGVGEPVLSYTKPDVGGQFEIVTPPESDEFNGFEAGLQWQWPANPSVKWGYMSGNRGFFRLNCIPKPDGHINLWDIPNIMLQKFPAEEFTATASIKFNARFDGEETGMVVMGTDYQYISVVRLEGKTWLRLVKCIGADKGSKEEIIESKETESTQLLFRIKVEKGAVCRFSYSTDGTAFSDLGESFMAAPGMWIGAKIGFFALRDGFINDSGNADIDWFRISKNE